MASPSLLLGSLRGSPWPSSGQRASACAASAWRTCVGLNCTCKRPQLHVRTSSAPNVFFPRLDLLQRSAAAPGREQPPPRPTVRGG
eukprot:4319227-Alexandrium_andersonii.AAC.1